MRGTFSSGLLVLSLVVGGCAGVRHRPVPPGSGDHIDGIRYYQTSMYLLVYADGKGGLGHEIMELPDPTKEMVAEPYATLASLNLEMTFKDGAFESATETADTTRVPAAILKALGQILPTGVKAHSTCPPGTVPAPRLYKIIVEGGDVRFEGVGTDTQFRVVTDPVPPGV